MWFCKDLRAEVCHAFMLRIEEGYEGRAFSFLVKKHIYV